MPVALLLPHTKHTHMSHLNTILTPSQILNILKPHHPDITQIHNTKAFYFNQIHIAICQHSDYFSIQIINTQTSTPENINLYGIFHNLKSAIAKFNSISL